MKKMQSIPNLALSLTLMAQFVAPPMVLAQENAGRATSPENVSPALSAPGATSQQQPTPPFRQTVPSETQQLNKILNGIETSAPNTAGQRVPTVPAGQKLPGIINDQPSIEQILNSTVNSSPNKEGTSLTVPSLPTDLKNLPSPALPPATDHNRNKVIDLGPIHTGPLLRIAQLGPLQLEATFNEPISLASILNYTVDNALPIRINAFTVQSNRYGFFGALGGFLPSVQTGYTWTHSHIYPHTNSNSRVYTESVSMPVFQGGRVMYSMLSQLYRYKASQQQYQASINDTLLNAYNAYYNLVLQRALLQIRVKSVEVSETQLRLNQQLFVAGTGTRFAVMQSQTQLALDRQALLQQQVALRQAALNLAFICNMPLAANLVPLESTVAESSLVDETLSIDDLLSLTLTRRPELRQYQLLYLSAARNIQVASSTLYPSMSFTQTYTHSSTTISQPQRSPEQLIQSDLNAIAKQQQQNNSSGGGGGNGGSSGGGGTGGGGTGGGGTGGGGTGGGGTGGSGSSSSSSSSTSSSSSSSGGSSIVGAGQFGGLFNTVSFQFNINYQLANLGVTAVTNILSARVISQQTMLQANQVLQQVSQQVRGAYLNALTAREQIDVTATGVESSAEELRLANLRVQMGIGTNLELIQAQRDYITALINQAQAIIQSNQAQAQLLHDTGLISVDSLLNGFDARRTSSTGRRTF